MKSKTATEGMYLSDFGVTESLAFKGGEEVRFI